MKVGFETVVGYVPREVLSVREHYSYLQPAMDALPAAEQARIRAYAPDEVHRLKDASAAEIMALIVAERALASRGLSPKDIDGLLVTQTGGRQFMPLLASYVHLNMGFDREMRVRNIVDDNVSIVNAAKIAWSYVRGGLCERVLIIAVAAQIGGQVKFGVDLTDPLAQWFGDGAAAAVVSSRSLECEFLGYHCETHPVKSRPGGTLNGNIAPVRPLANPSLASKAGMEDAYGAYLVLEDPLFDRVAGGEGFLTESLERAAKKAGLRASELATVITPHIGSLEERWIKDVAAAGLGAGALKNTSGQYGNTAVADVLLSLADLAASGRIESGSNVALWAACQGVQQSSLILRWN